MKTLVDIWSLFDRHQRLSAGILLLMMLVSMVLEVLGLGLVLPALAFMTGSPSVAAPMVDVWLARLGHPTQSQIIVCGLATLVVVFAAKAVFLVLTAHVQSRFIAALQTTIGTRLFSTYMFQPWTFHLQRNSSELIRNFNEISELSSPVSAAMSFVAEVLVLCGILAFLLRIEPLGTLTVIGMMGGSMLVIWRLSSGKLQRWGARCYEQRQHLNQHLQQGLGGNKDVRVRGCEHTFIAKLSEHLAAVSQLQNRQVFISQLPRLWLEFMAIVVVFVLTSLLLWRGSPPQQLIVSLGMFAAAAFRILPSVNRLTGSLQTLTYYRTFVETLQAELSLQVAGQREAGSPLEFHRRIVMEGVTYRFANTSTPALDDVTMRIDHGTSVGIVGGSGAGKSTAIDVLLGILDPEAGRVVVDGVDIRTNVRGWQKLLGYVPQTIYLCDDSLRENVAFGVPREEIDDKAVERAIVAARLDAFVAGLPEGLRTVVGERGVRLSGGQRQRVGIARALYHDPQILVLDEATSALDAETEAEVMAAVHALHGTKTMIIVAHRLSTVRQCDVLYRLEGGRVIRVGPFEEVVRP